MAIQAARHAPAAGAQRLRGRPHVVRQRPGIRRRRRPAGFGRQGIVAETVGHAAADVDRLAAAVRFGQRGQRLGDLAGLQRLPRSRFHPPARAEGRAGRSHHFFRGERRHLPGRPDPAPERRPHQPVRPVNIIVAFQEHRLLNERRVVVGAVAVGQAQPVRHRRLHTPRRLARQRPGVARRAAQFLKMQRRDAGMIRPRRSEPAPARQRRVVRLGVAVMAAGAGERLRERIARPLIRIAPHDLVVQPVAVAAHAAQPRRQVDVSLAQPAPGRGAGQNTDRPVDPRRVAEVAAFGRNSARDIEEHAVVRVELGGVVFKLRRVGRRRVEIGIEIRGQVFGASPHDAEPGCRGRRPGQVPLRDLFGALRLVEPGGGAVAGQAVDLQASRRRPRRVRVRPAVAVGGALADPAPRLVTAETPDHLPFGQTERRRVPRSRPVAIRKRRLRPGRQVDQEPGLARPAGGGFGPRCVEMPAVADRAVGMAFTARARGRIRLGMDVVGRNRNPVGIIQRDPVHERRQAVGQQQLRPVAGETALLRKGETRRGEQQNPGNTCPAMNHPPAPRAPPH
ncbi:MAG: hypothetical protein BWZ08_00809 [candidate division BRC1 bacterium ADurb.BinA292]|nr:MAG: hypothetical protein BWZ08_00809 [candidate division BRC1 bacterium ADurb.BinA292]